MLPPFFLFISEPPEGRSSEGLLPHSLHNVISSNRNLNLYTFMYIKEEEEEDILSDHCIILNIQYNKA